MPGARVKGMHMGDRCYMKVYCLPQHAPLFEALGFLLDDAGPDEDDGTVELIDEERNYGDTDELPKTVPFRGWHDEGGDYGGGVFACDGSGGFAIAETLHNSTTPAVECPRDGIDRERMDAAEAYYAMLDKAEAAFEAAKPAPTTTA